MHPEREEKRELELNKFGTKDRALCFGGRPSLFWSAGLAGLLGGMKKSRPCAT